MGPDSNINTLGDLLNEGARKFISAEVLLKYHLESWVKIAASFQLKIILYRYIDFVRQHEKTLESFFEEEDINFMSLSNPVMQAFIEETNQKLHCCTDDAVKDACLLACVQNINHFKISAYGTAAAFANTLDLKKAAAIFHELEINEKRVDDRLSQLAAFEINSKAVAPLALQQ